MGAVCRFYSQLGAYCSQLSSPLNLFKRLISENHRRKFSPVARVLKKKLQTSNVNCECLKKISRWKIQVFRFGVYLLLLKKKSWNSKTFFLVLDFVLVELEIGMDDSQKSKKSSRVIKNYDS